MTFDFNEKYILENEKIILKPLEETDFEKLLVFSLNEPEIWKYSLVDAIGENRLKNYINLALQGRNNKNEYPFVVIEKESNKIIGSTRFYDIQLNNKTSQLGFTWYGKEFQGTGVNKHCKYLLLKFAFEKIGFERIEFRADNNNERSIRAMKSIGCTIEGILRSNGVRPDGNRRDSIILSILKSEWYDKINIELKSKLEQNISG